MPTSSTRYKWELETIETGRLPGLTEADRGDRGNKGTKSLSDVIAKLAKRYPNYFVAGQREPHKLFAIGIREALQSDGIALSERELCYVRISAICCNNKMVDFLW